MTPLTRYAYPRNRPDQKLSPDLERLFHLQQDRCRNKASRILTRYQRRVKELDPQPQIITRGVPQAWHRDESDGYGWNAEW